MKVLGMAVFSVSSCVEYIRDIESKQKLQTCNHDNIVGKGCSTVVKPEKYLENRKIPGSIPSPGNVLKILLKESFMIRSKLILGDLRWYFNGQL